jgi:hypothetical protein
MYQVALDSIQTAELAVARPTGETEARSSSQDGKETSTGLSR